MIDTNPIVELEPKAHRYFDINPNSPTCGTEYTSVSKLISSVKIPFDTEGVSRRMSKGSDVEQQRLKDEWSKKGKDACDHGTKIHNALENYSKTFTLPEEPVPTQEDPEPQSLKPLVLSIFDHFKGYARTYDEECVWSNTFKVAGTADKKCLVTSRKDSTRDFYDYKTYLSRGVEYENKYKKYLLHPLDHLQECNFNTTALQLSLYAFMEQENTGCKIGKLAKIFIPPHDYLQWRLIYFPYMKMEAEALLKSYQGLKEIKKVISLSNFSE